MELLKVFLTKEEERVEREETTHEFTMNCELECEATKELLQLWCNLSLRVE